MRKLRGGVLKDMVMAALAIDGEVRLSDLFPGGETVELQGEGWVFYPSMHASDFSTLLGIGHHFSEMIRQLGARKTAGGLTGNKMSTECEKKDAENTDNEAVHAQLRTELEQKDAALAQLRIVLEQKDAALAQLRIVLEQKDAALEQVQADLVCHTVRNQSK